MSYRNDGDAGDWRKHPDHPAYAISRNGQVRGPRGTILRPETVVGGYQRVRLGRRRYLIHLLVADLFIGPKPAGRQVNHKDGDTSNNAVENLEYVTPSANVRHSLDVLGRKRAGGSRNGAARLSEEQVRRMRATFQAGGVTRTALANQYGVNRSTVGRIISGLYWPIAEGEKL
ncbi:HNH endonuclease [[Kitasatospora] papulosa]|uniref:HNH endonuclease n=1 Tax=[Kitasatospora] papulosa TaxID=1464011 RepID=UPI00403C9190